MHITKNWEEQDEEQEEEEEKQEEEEEQEGLLCVGRVSCPGSRPIRASGLIYSHSRREGDRSWS